MFYQVFVSSKVKQCTNITYKDSIYKLPHELPNALRLKILGNQEISGKCLNSIKWYHSAQSTWQVENFLNTSKEILKNRNWIVRVLFHVKTRVSLTYFVNDCGKSLMEEIYKIPVLKVLLGHSFWDTLHDEWRKKKLPLWLSPRFLKRFSRACFDDKNMFSWINPAKFVDQIIL